MARQENPFDMQIKLLMIGDSGAYLPTCLSVTRGVFWIGWTVLKGSIAPVPIPCHTRTRVHRRR